MPRVSEARILNLPELLCLLAVIKQRVPLAVHRLKRTKTVTEPSESQPWYTLNDSDVQIFDNKVFKIDLTSTQWRMLNALNWQISSACLNTVSLRTQAMSSLLHEDEYDVKNFTDQGGCYQPRWITASEISIILHIIRRPNTIIVLLLIQNISNFLTSLLPRSLLHSRF